VLKRLRKAARLKQAALASAAGISQPTLSRLENGQRPPTDEERSALAEALKCPAAAI